MQLEDESRLRVDSYLCFALSEMGDLIFGKDSLTFVTRVSALMEDLNFGVDTECEGVVALMCLGVVFEEEQNRSTCPLVCEKFSEKFPVEFMQYSLGL